MFLFIKAIKLLEYLAMAVQHDYIIQSINSLDQWIENNGWAGYDPYDIRELDIVIKIADQANNNYIFEVLRELMYESFSAFPVISRKIFNVKPQINAKGMALSSAAYLELYKIYSNTKYLEKSQFCLKWLEENQSRGFTGNCWGYPFNWQTKALIPRFTPNGIVTTAAGDAFWSWYQYTNDKKYLAVCEGICEFLCTLLIDKISNDQICFSYTPVYINHVHNLNLFVAEYLLKIGLEVNNDEWINLGLRATNYTLSNQLDNGAFDYNGPPEKPQNFSDNYHTGFVLRMLYSIWKLTDDNNVYNSMDRCYQHYITNFFEDNIIPKLLPDRKYRIDIHSCAESINCLSQLSIEYPDALQTAKNVADWTIRNLQDESGYFYYGIFKSRFTGRVYVSKISYMRWSQAWMLKGLSKLLRYVK